VGLHGWGAGAAGVGTRRLLESLLS
jgi:hypothetical protein